MRPLSRPRPRWSVRLRRPRPSTLLTVAAALVTFVFVHDISTDAESGRSGWEQTTEVWVSSVDLPPGAVARPGDARSAVVPSFVVPVDAITVDPAGRTARSPIGPSEILVDHRFSGAAQTGAAALLGPDQRGIAVPKSGVDLALRVGDQVDVLATLEPFSTDTDPTITLIERATVIAADDDTVTLAVDRESTRTLTHALATATVTLALVG